MMKILLCSFLTAVCLFVGTYSAGTDSSSSSNLVSITYTVWVYSNVSEEFTLKLNTERHTSFYDVMQQAAQQDSRYEFEANKFSWGHYITKLAGHQEIPAEYTFWMIYKTPRLPDPAHPPSDALLTPVGVDEIQVNDAEHYLFWLKKI
ncbi:uncharacterized protein CG3556 [Anabrus simplex]|uniref:uncharacterized protein CG3556 n=1 Tax=Anabrus simplex TaxID=316456 RepID=UPI0035A2EA63